MYLNNTDIARFYKIWMGILDYTNKKYKVAPKLKEIKTPMSLNPADLVPIKDLLWKNSEIIDQFILENPCSLGQQDMAVISSWKRRISGKFILLKHLTYYSVFMSTEEGGRLYAATGISDALCDMFHSSRLPAVISAVLIPFEGKIIYDGMLFANNIRIGSNMKKDLNDEYRVIKAKRGIITEL
jgi:hypothetical protein